jgi:hypothetical protein
MHTHTNTRQAKCRSVHVTHRNMHVYACAGVRAWVHCECGITCHHAWRGTAAWLTKVRQRTLTAPAVASDRCATSLVLRSAGCNIQYIYMVTHSPGADVASQVPARMWVIVMCACLHGLLRAAHEPFSHADLPHHCLQPLAFVDSPYFRARPVAIEKEGYV